MPSFGDGCTFGDGCDFGADCTFGAGCSFGDGCTFGVPAPPPDAVSDYGQDMDDQPPA